MAAAAAAAVSSHVRFRVSTYNVRNIYTLYMGNLYNLLHGIPRRVPFRPRINREVGFFPSFVYNIIYT